jgi:hypothetical protein
MSQTSQSRNVLVVISFMVPLTCGGPLAQSVHAEEPQPSAPTREAGMLRFEPLVVNDPLFGQEAFRVLLPADWHGSGQVEWRFHPQYPAGIRVQAYNPAGVEAVWSYPLLPFVAGVLHLPPGGRYLGNEVRPYPGDISGYVRQYLLPRFRPDIRTYRVLAVEAMPEWARTSSVAEGVCSLRIPCQVQAGRVRIGYALNGQQVEEEFSVMLDSLYILGLHYWGAEWATSVRAAAGRLDPVRRIQVTMVSSLRLNLSWYSRERQVASTFEQMLYQEQQAVMNISRILAQTNDHITATIRSSYENRQAVLDRVHARFSEYIRGVETYRSPDGQRIQLPSGYRQAWVNNRGEYLLSDNANFNPNVQMKGEWHALQPMR